MATKRLLCLMGGLGLSAAVTFAATATTMSVQVRKAEIRETPSYLGRVVSSIAYGDKVTVDELLALASSAEAKTINRPIRLDP